MYGLEWQSWVFELLCATTSPPIISRTNLFCLQQQSIPHLRESGAPTILTIAIESCEPVNGKDVYHKGTVQLVDCCANTFETSAMLKSLGEVVKAASSGAQPNFEASVLTDMLRDAIGNGTLTRFVGIGDLPSMLNTGCVLLRFVLLSLSKPNVY